MLSLFEIEKATLLHCQPIDPKEKGVNETYIGLISTEKGEKRAYIKVLNQKQLINEVIANILGRYIGLPMPTGYVIYADMRDIPNSKILNETEKMWIFGCEEVPFAKKLRDGGISSAQLIDMFNKWSDTVAFDDWIANIDRHLGNIVLSGKDFFLIDHSHCFTGPNWDAEYLKAMSLQRFQNRLFDFISSGLNRDARMELIIKARKLLANVVEGEVTEGINSVAKEHLIKEEIDSLIYFLRVRQGQVEGNIADLCGMPILQN